MDFSLRPEFLSSAATIWLFFVDLFSSGSTTARLKAQDTRIHKRLSFCGPRQSAGFLLRF